jgi:hypothetical protein
MISTTWTAPDNPNPSEILHSAVDDTRKGSHEEALAKFLWFHNNALQYERGLSAVRHSFALAYWLDLATIYRPAHDAFIRTRNETEAAFRESPYDFDLFHDVASMNDRLGDGIRTADLFANGPFLDPGRQVELAAQRYGVLKHHEESRPVGDIQLARKLYIRDAATLVGLLALNDRAEDARSAYNAALRVLNDDDFRTVMDAAMTGHLPERRPR